MPRLRVLVVSALHLGCICGEAVDVLMHTAIDGGGATALDGLTECHDLLANPGDQRAR